jgi:AraC-like DNA-binding protein
MAGVTDSNVPKIVYSSTTKRIFEGEIFIRQHVFDYIISGTSDVSFGGKTDHYKAGDLRFVVKNRLSKFVKNPEPDGEYKSISICIDNNTLMEIKAQYETLPPLKKAENVFLINQNVLFSNYIDSLLPYLEKAQHISENLIKVKIKEAVLIFMESNPQLQNILFDFGVPGKIDLEGYMNEHYRYNGDLQNFAYLTGRSLSTFKRDFEKIFSISPNKWLIQKRLEEAKFLLEQKKIRATDVYVDVGFKDYSHFSAAFKRFYGVAPTHI